MLVKVGSFIFPVDFVILDMEEDREVPIILGRPFLATSNAIINVKKGNVTLEFDEDKLTFNIFKSLQYPSEDLSNYQVNTIEAVVQEVTNQAVEGKDDDALEALVLVEDEEVQIKADKMLGTKDPEEIMSGKAVEKLELSLKQKIFQIIN